MSKRHLEKTLRACTRVPPVFNSNKCFVQSITIVPVLSYPFRVQLFQIDPIILGWQKVCETSAESGEESVES